MELRLEKMCRVCMRDDVAMLPLFPEGADAPNYSDLIMAISTVKIMENDGLPRQLCTQCAVKLNTAVDFKSICEKSDTLYREYLVEKAHESLMQQNLIKEEMACEQTYDITNIAISGGEYNEDEFLIFKSEPEVQLNEEEKLALNMEIGTSKKYNSIHQCVSCDKSYASAKALKKHTMQHHAATAIDTLVEEITKGKYTCEHCGMDAPNTTMLMKHYKAFHKDKNADKIQGATSEDSSDYYNAEEFIIATESTESAQMVTATAGGAIATIKEEVGQSENLLVLEVTYRCPICKIQYENQQSYAAHMTKHSGRLPKGVNEFKCNLCDKVFSKRKNLKQHVLTHSKEKTNKCTLCHRAFTRPDQLVLHMNNHTGKKRHQCIHCNKGFNMLSTLKDHLRTHSGEKPYLCSICGKGFTQNTNLKQHLMRHSAIKPFNCDTCQAKFVSKGELDAHARKHTGDHPFVCDTCGTGFTTSSSLVKHKRIHTGERPYACDLCQLRFTALGTLKNHRRTHTGEKPYACSHCSRAFAQKSDLVSHTRTHTGERPYVCSTCCSPFHQLSALKIHIRNYHPIVKPEESMTILKISPDNSNSTFACVESTE